MSEDPISPAVVRPRVLIGGGFELTDHFGSPVTDETYHGRFALLFFGFTHCRVICPDMLDRISRALDTMGPEADAIQPLYITVDPDRDSPEVMRSFLKRFPRFTGLTGDKGSIDAVKKAYKVYAEREAADETGNYDVPHSAMIFVVDPSGHYVRHFADTTTPATLSAGLRKILAED